MTTRTANENYKGLQATMARDQKVAEILEQAIAGRAVEMAAKYSVRPVGLYRDPFAPKEL